MMALHPHDDAGHAIYEEQRTHGAPDPDPLMPCQGCDREYRTSYFKQFGQVSADPDVPVLCPECLKELTGIKSVEAREAQNQAIQDFTEEAVGGSQE